LPTDEWFSERSLLTWPDFAVVAVLLASMVVVGAWFERRQTSTREFFLGDRSVPWWAASLSLVATEVSAVTVISVPATAFRENWQYLQFFVGSAAARLVIAYLFIPAFYSFDCTTIYEFLGRRFGRLTQTMASLFFFLTRLLGSGVRLMAACLAMSVLIGWHILPVIVLFILISVAYMGLGGMRAVVWTNVIQALVFIAGGLVTVAFLLHEIHGGLPAVVDVAGAAGRLDILKGGPSLSDTGFWKTIMSDPNIWWLAILNGFFGSMAAFGTDQDLAQRLLTVETRRESQRTMTLTIPTSLFVLVIYMCVGAGLYVFYQQNPGLPQPDKLDKIFPHFIGHVMPPVMRGLLLSAIVLASIDSPLASLATSFVTDLYRPLRPGLSDRVYLRISRWCVVGFGAVLAVLAYLFSFLDKILWLAFKIGGVTFGSLLGVFLLGLLTKRPSNRADALSMTVSASIMFVLLILSEKGILPLGWSWLVILGTVVTFAGGWVLGPVMDANDDRRKV
jgi:SSS family transporter